MSAQQKSVPILEASEPFADFSNARASPAVCDAHLLRPTAVRNVQGLPGHERSRLKKLAQKKKEVKLRIGTLNVGSMTRRGLAVADLMARRRIQILCVQETRWTGNKAKELGGGFKLYYSGAKENKRNGVGIVLDNEMKNKVVSVSRTSDRVMSLKIQLDEMELNIVSTYAPQVGCDDDEKDLYWREVEQEVTGIPRDERIYFAGDLNGHIGKGNNEITGRIRGIWGIGDMNNEGESILDFALATDMAILNTYFQKEDRHLVTYKSGNKESQIDFILYRRQHLKEIQNCSVILNEAVAPQHRLLVTDAIYSMAKKKDSKITTPKIRWWKLKEIFMKTEFKRLVIEKVKMDEEVDVWKKSSRIILEVAEKVLGKTSGKGAPKNKETWWGWECDEVQKAIKDKKISKMRWDLSGKAEDKVAYRRANREANRAVAIAKDRALKSVYDELETREGEKKIYRIAKARDKATKDFTHIKQMKNREGVVLKNETEIKERWRAYFNELMNEENPREPCENSVPNQGIVRDIERKEIADALRNMKNGKATGPDGIPIEAWKSLEGDGIDLLEMIMEKVFNDEKIPDEWRESVIVPIYKEKGDIQECSNYRGIKLMSHTMKLFERIIDKRIRRETVISDQQFGFMPGRSTTDAVFAVRQLMEKHLEKDEDLSFVFIDLEKAYDRVPREEIWRCMREKGMPEKYVRVVKDMYDGATSRIRSSVGLTEQIPVRVGLHQGSALSPYLFDIIMDVLTDHVRKDAPWCMMFADDVVLCGLNAEEIERDLECWRKALEEKGLKINRTKTVQLNFGKERSDKIHLGGVELLAVKKFKYLGSVVNEKGDLDDEIAHRVNAAWMNWKRMTGVLCDKRMNLRMKGKIHRTVVRPAMMYGAETWAIKKAQEKRLEVAEMRMLRWSCGVTRLDRIRNEVIRNKIKVTEISKKIQESRLRWYGHVERRDENYVGKKVGKIEVGGKRNRGRPKKTWKECVKRDLVEKGLTGKEWENRADWRRLSKSADPD